MKNKTKHIIFFVLISLVNITAQPTLEWVKEYTGDFPIQRARDIEVDDSGNVYVGTTSFDTLTSYGMTLIKYDKDGEKKWIRKYEGPQNPGSSADHLQAITRDSKNNIYITGASEYSQPELYLGYITFITIKYNSRGEKQWLAKYRIDSLRVGWYWPYTIAVDSSENVYIGGNFDKSILLKYNSNGELLWDKNIDSIETVRRIVLDDLSNIYIANTDLSILKFDTNGNFLWKAYSDIFDGIEAIHNIEYKIDLEGNTFAAGYYYPDVNVNNNIIISVKYDKDGNFQWVKKYGQEKRYYMHESTGCNLDSNGNFYVSGWFWNQNNFETKYLLIKYNPLGDEQFVSEYNATEGTWLTARNTTIDKKDNIYITGKEKQFNQEFGDLIFVKFNTEGNILFSEKYGILEKEEEAYYITISNQNNIHILAENHSSRDATVLTLKYTQTPVGVEEEEELLPLKFVLYQNYPNPFNPTTIIKYSIPLWRRVRGVLKNVTLKIYDILGSEVTTLVNKQQKSGKYKVTFNAENLPTGIYFYRLTTGEFTITHKLLLIK